jgi:lipopolysaccharide transport system ATP-binding protein
MREPVITVKNISKSYNISHEMKANAGTVTFRDAIINTLKKPKELLTGHIMKKEKFWALKGIDFKINKGEVVGIIGKNGSGKSTLLKIMSRITEPTAGEIVMNGRVASLLEVGTGFHPELTGRENVYFNGSILGMKKKEIDAKFDEIVAFSEVEKFLDTPVKFYSSGMYVRLAFAVAAHLDPDILIVDEVLAVGDAAFQKKSLGKMKQSAAEGRTVLFVSHSMQAVEKLCTKAIMLESGKVVDIGSVKQVINRYSGTPSINKSRKNEWVNKGVVKPNEYFSINKFSIVDEHSKPVLGVVSDDDYRYIEIDLDVIKSDPKLTIGYCLFDEEGNCLLWSYQTDAKNYKVIEQGKHKIISKIPLENLNTGNYRLSIIGGIHNKEWLLNPDDTVASFYFEFKKDSSSSSNLYNDQRPTMMSIISEWKVK